MRKNSRLGGMNPTIESKILLLRGQRVILDTDLSFIYAVATKDLN